MNGTDASDLNANPSAERIAVADRLKPQQGLVAVLDALGVSLFSLDEAREFVRVRDSILTFTDDIIDSKVPGLDVTRLRRFTLNDTVVFVYETPHGVSLREVEQFAHVLRLFETKTIIETIPFRGALGIGEFYVGDQQTVLGPAVVDAASRYEDADWIGIHATPHATMLIRSLLEQQTGVDMKHVLVEYHVPLRDGRSSTDKLLCINWPKGFYLRQIRPDGLGRTRGLVLGALAKRRVPKGTESKYSHTIEFFDHIESEQHLEQRFVHGESV